MTISLVAAAIAVPACYCFTPPRPEPPKLRADGFWYDPAKWAKLDAQQKADVLEQARKALLKQERPKLLDGFLVAAPGYGL